LCTVNEGTKLEQATEMCWLCCVFTRARRGHDGEANYARVVMVAFTAFVL